MDKLKQDLYRYLLALGCDFGRFLRNKNERIKFQKYCYLIKKLFNLKLNGSYSLYLNGPYNSKLADDLFEIANKKTTYENFYRANPLSDETVISRLETLRNIFIENDPPINEVDLLEFYTTYSYLKENYPSLRDEEVIDELRKRKPIICSTYECNDIDIIPMIINIYERLQVA